MLKMMVVDDEMICRKGIRTCIHWASYGITIVAEAENGAEALKKAEKLHPDILITDIKMPEMDGISLAKTLHSRYPEMAVIVISAYAEFEYARELLKLGVEDYLLRPYGTDELLKCVLKTKERLLQCRQMEQDSLHLHDFLDENRVDMRSSFLMDFLQSRAFQPEKFRSRCQLLHIRFPAARTRILLADMDIFDVQTALIPQKKRAELISQAVSRLDQLFPPSDQVISFRAGKKQLGMIIPVTARTVEETLHVARFIQNLLDTEFGISASMLLSELCFQSEDFPKQYRELLRLLPVKAHARKSVLVCGRTTAERAAAPFSCPLESKLLAAVRARDFERVFQLWQEFCDSFDKEIYTLQSLKTFCRYFLSKALTILENGGRPVTEQLEEEYGHYNDIITEIEFFDDLLSGFMRELLHAIERLVTDTRRDEKKRPIREALKFMEEHYTEPISLNQVAAACYISPAHLSRMFTKEVETTFTSWLNHYRVEQAKRLFQTHPEMKTYEVAQAVGFKDYKYFSFVFKRLEDCLPREYKHTGT